MGLYLGLIIRCEITFFLVISRRPEYACIRYSGNGQKIYSSTPQALTVFDTQTGRLLQDIENPSYLRFPDCWIDKGLFEFAISDTNPELAFVPLQGGISIFDLRSFAHLGELPRRGSNSEFHFHYPPRAIQIDSERQIVYVAANGIVVYGSLVRPIETDSEKTLPKKAVLIDTNFL